MTTSRDELLVLLGELKEGLAGVKADIIEFKESSKEAAVSRGRIYDKLEDGEQRLTAMESTVRVMAGVLDKTSTRVDALEPSVRSAAKSLRAWNKRYLAALAVASLVFGWIWWVVSQNWGWLVSSTVNFIKGLSP